MRMTQPNPNWNFDAEENTFHAIPSNANPRQRLPAGAYAIQMGMAGPYIEAIKLKDEELIRFDDGPSSTILNEIQKFWGIADRYAKLGVPYRRGILMYGEPGTGKSGIVRMVCDSIIDQDGLVMMVKNPGVFTSYLPVLDRAEPGRNIVVVLEDIDNLYCRDEHEFLQMLDGISNYRPGLVFLATTNFLDRIPGRIYRPSRFDLLIEVGSPSASVRQQYVRDLCARYGVEFREDIVEASNGLAFAHLKEMLISCLLYDYPVDEVAARMRKHYDLGDDTDNEEDEDWED